MSKTLIFLRHAKSDWSHENLSDHVRPLNVRGRRNAAQLARYIAAEHIWPDAIFCSDATRTRETVQIMRAEWANHNAELSFVSKLYHAPAVEYLRQAAEFGEPANIGMLVGHNPGISIAVGQLAESIDHMPTCAVAVFEFKASQWCDLAQLPRPNFRLTHFQTPKLLGDQDATD